MNERRALVVESDPATRTAVRGLVRRCGYQCVAVSSADAARDALAEGGFSFTFVDLGFDGADHAELIRSLKASGRNSGAIIVVGDHLVHDQKASELAVDAVLPKPVNLDDIEDAINNIARLSTESFSAASAQVPDRLSREIDLWRSPR